MDPLRLVTLDQEAEEQRRRSKYYVSDHDSLTSMSEEDSATEAEPIQNISTFTTILEDFDYQMTKGFITGKDLDNFTNHRVILGDYLNKYKNSESGQRIVNDYYDTSVKLDAAYMNKLSAVYILAAQVLSLRKDEFTYECSCGTHTTLRPFVKHIMQIHSNVLQYHCCMKEIDIIMSLLTKGLLRSKENECNDLKSFIQPLEESEAKKYIFIPVFNRNKDFRCANYVKRFGIID